MISLSALKRSYWIDFTDLIVYLLDTMDSVKDVLGKWGKKAAEASKKAGDIAGNTWQHCKCLGCSLSVLVMSLLVCMFIYDSDD